MDGDSYYKEKYSLGKSNTGFRDFSMRKFHIFSILINDNQYFRRICINKWKKAGLLRMA